MGKTLNRISHSFMNPLRSLARPEKGFCSGTFPTESVFERTAAVTRAVICASVSAIFDDFFCVDGGTGGTDEFGGPTALGDQSGSWVSTCSGDGIGVRKAGGLYLWSPSWRSRKAEAGEKLSGLSCGEKYSGCGKVTGGETIPFE